MERDEHDTKLASMERDIRDLLNAVSTLSREIANERAERIEMNRNSATQFVQLGGNPISNPFVTMGATSGEGESSVFHQITSNEIQFNHLPPPFPVNPSIPGGHQFTSFPQSYAHAPIPSLPHITPDPFIISNQGITNQNDSTEQRLKSLEHYVRNLTGAQPLGSIDPASLSLVPGVVLPSKFKVPEFHMYDGNGCPMSHIKMYIRKMTPHIQDEKLLIHCFQESLTGDASLWYNELESNMINSWSSLCDAFLNQYRHNIDMAPTRSELGRQYKSDNESFKDYARRWRSMAARVRPSLTEKEMTELFINTLRSPFIEHMLSCSMTHFGDLVAIGDRIEDYIRRGILQTPGNKKMESKKREAEISLDDPAKKTNPFGYQSDQEEHRNQVANIYPPTIQQPFIPPLSVNALPYVPPQRYLTSPMSNMQNVFSQATNVRPRQPIPSFPIPPLHIFRQLLAAGKITPIPPLPPLNQPFPSNYNINAICEYHSNSPGHSTNSCVSLRRRLQGLIDQGNLRFTSPDDPYHSQVGSSQGN